MFGLFKNKPYSEEMSAQSVKLGQNNRHEHDETLRIDTAGLSAMMVVEGVFKITGIGVVLTGVVREGHFKLSQVVSITSEDGTHMITSVIRRLEMLKKHDFKTVGVGENIGMVLGENISKAVVSRGSVIRGGASH